MKKSPCAPLWATIFFMAWVGIGGADSSLPAPTGGTGPGMFMDLPSSDRLLEDVESCRVIREENSVLYRLNEKNEQLEEIRKEREALLRERIDFLERQQGELLRMNEQAIKTADLARKAGGGTWYEQLFTAGKWIGLGILLGFVAGAAK